jgi:hypothetical protein
MRNDVVRIVTVPWFLSGRLDYIQNDMTLATVAPSCFLLCTSGTHSHGNVYVDVKGATRPAGAIIGGFAPRHASMPPSKGRTSVNPSARIFMPIAAALTSLGQEQ